MEFFAINLNKLEDPRLVLKRIRARNLSFAAVAACALVITIGLVLINSKLNKKYREFAQIRKSLEKQVEQMRSSSGYISEADVQALYELDRSRIFWSKKLEALSGLVDNSMSITYVHFTDGKLLLRGIAKASKSESKFGLISSFVERLKTDSEFSETFGKIEFCSSNKIDFSGQEILNFELMCYQK